MQYVIKMCDKKNTYYGKYLEEDSGKYVKNIQKATLYNKKEVDMLEPGDKFVKIKVTVEEA